MEGITLAPDEISIDDAGEFKPKEKFEGEIKLPGEEIYQKVSNISHEKGLIMEFVITDISYSDGSKWKR